MSLINYSEAIELVKEVLWLVFTVMSYTKSLITFENYKGITQISSFKRAKRK
ncbi:hypothetical protein TEH_09230 [Tetragenococcus halophilus NBRC 12172]|uniref:Uncharacterized protein n=1 Tax=Tetragenococcus halophilus (strain DSM 20338 / JCM 20259 / NCIMB 9735 / NBRC 12172) TaxID=945021 RepID=A0AAN1VQP8_TETHN|nr:hypothetical protein TEH_09230 [Tetragenococcus halophilus NBRC 12172]